MIRDFVDFVRTLALLTTTVSDLRSSVARLDDRVTDHEGRLGQLAAGEEITAARAEATFATAAVRVYGDLLERIVRLEVAVGIGGARRLGDGGG